MNFYQLHQRMLNEGWWPWGKAENPDPDPDNPDPVYQKLLAQYPDNPEYAMYLYQRKQAIMPSNKPARKYRGDPYQRTDIPGDPHATGDLRNPSTDPLSKREFGTEDPMRPMPKNKWS
jgi:hypothetical protein